MRKNKITSLMVAIVLCVNCVMPILAADDSNTVYISSAENLITFSQKCTLDIWSQGKTVMLTSDIDLSGTEFTSIPTFGGMFDGQGHTISGLSITDKLSTIGLFSNVQEGAVIQNLNVSATITPSEDQDTIGGIAGSNSGTINNCSFNGTVKGEKNVGGIVGVNLESGKVTNSSSAGTASGQTAVGGICGKNLGTLIHCTNASSVNTQANDTSFDIEDIQTQINSFLDSVDTLTISDTGQTADAISGSTDTGGIVGYSSGIIQGCINNGKVGYPHVGYNVGGIAGRQAGYLLGSSNTGEIYGRKDVGGIVGQMEPYVILDASGDTLNQLQIELNKLNSLINTALDDSDSSSTEISAHLTNIEGYSTSANNYSKDLMNQTTDFVDTNVGKINDLSAIVANVLDKMVPILNNAEAASDTMTTAVSQIQDALGTLESASKDGTHAIHYMELATDDLITAGNNVQSAETELNDALTLLSNAVAADDEAAVNEALADITEAITELSDALQDASTALSTLSSTLEGVSDLSDLIANSSAIIASLSSLSLALADIATALGKIANDITVIYSNTSINWSDIQEALDDMSAAMDDLSQAADDLDSALNNFNTALDYAEATSDEVTTAIGQIQEATGTIKTALQSLTSAVSGLKDLTEELSELEHIESSTLGDEYRETSQNLYNSLTGLSSEMEALNQTVESSSQTLTKDLRAASNQFNVVMNLMVSALRKAGDASTNADITNYMEDTSDEDIDNTTLGKVADCTNKGTVQADKDVGGIAGAMAIESSADPEGNIEKPNTFDFVYKTKSVLKNNVNIGEITGKMDCVGGVVGLMNLGIAVECQNYGKAVSSEGDYVGGIAGDSSSVIQDSYAKCILSGKSYIGGIAGSGYVVTGCYTLVSVECFTNFTGAIAGAVTNSAKDNYFVSDDLAGIDRVSYAGKAEPMSYADLEAVNGIPENFKSFTLTFVVDGKVIKTVNVNYGISLDVSNIPEAPARDGYYVKWSQEDFSCVTCDEVIEAIYTPYVTALASEQKRDDTQSVLLVMGHFTEESALTLIPLEAGQTGLKNAAEQWQFSVTDDGLSAHEVRYLAPGGNTKSVSIYMNQEGKWVKLSTVTSGKYLTFTIQGDEATIAIVSKSPTNMILLYLIAAVAVVILLVFLFFVRKRKRKI